MNNITSFTDNVISFKNNIISFMDDVTLFIDVDYFNTTILYSCTVQNLPYKVPKYLTMIGVTYYQSMSSTG